MGTYSQGKVEEGDEGDLALGLGVDERHRIIRIEFGTEVTWIGLDLQSARLFSASLLAAIKKLEGIQ